MSTALTMIDASDETMRLTSLRLAELHFAMLDFIILGNPTTDRSKLVRAAVERLVMAHENWDLDRFLDFAKRSYAPKIRKKAIREAFLETLKTLKAAAEDPQRSAFDVAHYGAVPTSAADFDL